MTLVISEAAQPNFPDYPTSTYASQGREIRFVPESTGPMRPNFIPCGPSTRMVGRFYPTGTSAPMYSVDDLKPLVTTGTVKSQLTVGRWVAVCDNDSCLEDCAEGFREKNCRIDMQTKQTTSSVQFLGRCNSAGFQYRGHSPRCSLTYKSSSINTCISTTPSCCEY